MTTTLDSLWQSPLLDTTVQSDLLDAHGPGDKGFYWALRVNTLSNILNPFGQLVEIVRTFPTSPFGAIPRDGWFSIYKSATQEITMPSDAILQVVPLNSLNQPASPGQLIRGWDFTQTSWKNGSCGGDNVWVPSSYVELYTFFINVPIVWTFRGLGTGWSNWQRLLPPNENILSFRGGHDIKVHQLLDNVPPFTQGDRRANVFGRIVEDHDAFTCEAPGPLVPSPNTGEANWLPNPSTFGPVAMSGGRNHNHSIRFGGADDTPECSQAMRITWEEE